METLETQLLSALDALEAAARNRASGGPASDVRPHLAELDRLTRELPPGANPELLHYLHQRSYAKARLFLEGRLAEIQRGGCRRTAS